MWKFIKKGVLFFLLIHIVYLFYGKYYNPPLTITQLSAMMEFGRIDRKYISYDQMSTHVKKAVIASEDQLFFQHNGFDIKAIEKAFQNNEQGKNRKGGSTISQQTAKNVFLWQSRTWFRKGLEAIYTFLIEKIWGKEVILERYLNSIEMGKGVFGVEAAAQYYFNKSAENITKSEAAWIAAVLPSPKKYDPKNPTPYLRKKHLWIMKQMNHISIP